MNTRLGRPYKLARFLYISILLSILLISIYRFLFFLTVFEAQSLQMDFSAYYTAGESLNHGWSPYLNYINSSPPVWDGVNLDERSRFLYPPLVASLFQPLALLPYSVAKFTWMLFELMAAISVFMIVLKQFQLKNPELGAWACIFVLWYFPFLAHLERGQIDIFTLLLITTSINLMVGGTGKDDVFAGVLLALAALLKLYVVYFLPFLLIRKRLNVVLGFIYGVLLIVAFTYIFQDGFVHMNDYVFNHLHHVADVEANGGANILTGDNAVRLFSDLIPEGFQTSKDGNGYYLSLLNFHSNATLVKPFREYLVEKNIDISIVTASIGLFGIFFGLIWMWNVRFSPEAKPASEEYLYWQIPLVVTLLVSPITWTMNLVWLMPLVVISLSLLSESQSIKRKIAISIILIALGLAMVSAAFDFRPLSLIFRFLGNYQYIISELLVLMGLVLFLGDFHISKNHFFSRKS